MAGVTLDYILSRVDKDLKKRLSAQTSAAQKQAAMDADKLKNKRVFTNTTAARHAMNNGSIVMDASPQSSRYKVGKNWLKAGDYGAYKGSEKIINSTAISNMKYNPNNEVMELQFTNGKHSYAYPDVPPRIVEKFESALSKGRFVNKSVKPYGVKGFRGHA